MIDFPVDFFQEEVRSDFTVPSMMKRCWAAQMEILQVIADICSRNQLTYYADAGTLLGAVRHKGFIPWDDDIDIAMKRDDYNKLLKLLPYELPKGFRYGGTYTEIRKQSTHSFVCSDPNSYDKWSDYVSAFHGFAYPAAVDIFPLDNVPKNKDDAQMQMEILTIISNCLACWKVCEEDNTLEGYLRTIEDFCNVDLGRDENTRNRLCRLEDSIASLYNSDEGDEITIFDMYANGSYPLLKKGWYSKTVTLPFENITVEVPVNYHEVLCAIFGDYMTPVKFTSLHNYPCYGNYVQSLRQTLDEKGITDDIDTIVKNIVGY